jgi:predicted RNA-binding protein YlqC (UPF0109 family)
MAQTPDYQGLIEHLMKPFLDSPEALKTNIESLSGGQKVWLRVAFSSEDRGRMFGRSGRNIQAIRTVLEATAALYGQRVSLDVYGETAHQARTHDEDGSSGESNRRSPRRPSRGSAPRD